MLLNFFICVILTPGVIALRCVLDANTKERPKNVRPVSTGTNIESFLSLAVSHFSQIIQQFLLLVAFLAVTQGHPTDRFGEYLFGRPIIVYDFRIEV